MSEVLEFRVAIVLIPIMVMGMCWIVTELNKGD